MRELRNGLEGRLSEQDIGEVMADYGDILESAVQEGKSEEQAAADLGSPARIARTILEGDGLKKKEQSYFRGGIQYQPFVGRFANMGRRLAAAIIDGALVFFLVLLMIFFDVALAGVGTARSVSTSMNQFAALFTVLTLGLLVGTGLLYAIFLWSTNGYTPGKWLLQIRVVKLSGGKLTFMDALMREVLVKGLGNAFTSGLLNIFSFLWGCMSEVRKTVHDLAAETTVVNAPRS